MSDLFLLLIIAIGICIALPPLFIWAKNPNYLLEIPPPPSPPKFNKSEDWDESRADTIGQNGNDGLHYENKQ